MGGCPLEKIRTSECSRVPLGDLVGSLGSGVNDLEPLCIEVAVFGVSLKFFQEPEKFSCCFLWISSRVEGLGKLPTVRNFLVIVSIRDCDLLFDNSF